MEAVTDLFRRDWEGLKQRVDRGVSVVIINMREREIFLV